MVSVVTLFVGYINYSGLTHRNWWIEKKKTLRVKKRLREEKKSYNNLKKFSVVYTQPCICKIFIIYKPITMFIQTQRAEIYEFV